MGLQQISTRQTTGKVILIDDSTGGIRSGLTVDTTVPVGGAGTGTVTNTEGALTAHQLVTGGGGNDAQTEIAPGSAGQVLTSQGAGLPAIFAAASSSINFIVGETPAGAVNGSNKDFTLAHNPITAGSQVGYLNGLRQQPGAGKDYTIAGNVVSFIIAPPTGSIILFDYRF